MLEYLQDGLVPNIFCAGKKDSDYGSADASLWFARAVRLAERASTNHDAVAKRFLPGLREIARHYARGTGLALSADTSGLLRSGSPRNDPLVRPTIDVEAVRNKLEIPPGHKVVLYAPTFRDRDLRLNKQFELQLDLDALLAELGNDHYFLVRPHYLDKLSLPRRHQRFVGDASKHPDVTELLVVADVLVTDYSSVMFDYANLDRPIVVHAPDWETYRTVRGVYFDLLSGAPGETPGPVTSTTDELIGVFTDGTWCGEESTTLRGAFRERFCPYDDGRAAERVVRGILLGETTPVPLVPLAERTPAPAASSLSPTATAMARQTQAAIAHQPGGSSRMLPVRPMTHQGAPQDPV